MEVMLVEWLLGEVAATFKTAFQHLHIQNMIFSQPWKSVCVPGSPQSKSVALLQHEI